MPLAQLWKALTQRLEGDLDCQLATPPGGALDGAGATASPEADDGSFRLFRLALLRENFFYLQDSSPGQVSLHCAAQYAQDIKGPHNIWSCSSGQREFLTRLLCLCVREAAISSHLHFAAAQASSARHAHADVCSRRRARCGH